MNNGIEGIPGSGKSYEAVVYHVLPALQAGRKVITNLPLNVEAFRAIDPAYPGLIEVRRRCQPIRGTWDANRMDDAGDGQAFEVDKDGELRLADVSVPLFGQVWDFYTTWRHPETGHGPLFVIDECHVAFPKIGTDKAVIEWFKLHRHFNVDVLLMTQSFRDVCPSIAMLMGVLVKCRKADILGKKDRYIRKVHGGYRGAIISTEERPYKPQYFHLYKSHTQGKGIAELGASDVSPFLVKFNRFKNVFLIVAVAFAVWAFWPGAEKPKQKPSWRPTADHYKAATPTPSPVPQPASVPIPIGSAATPVVYQPISEDGEMPEPFVYKGLHLTGVMRKSGRDVYTFAVSHNMVYVAAVTSEELEAIGYKFRPLTDCAGALSWKNKTRAVICDAPKVADSVKVDSAEPERPPAAPQVTVWKSTWDSDRIARSGR